MPVNMILAMGRDGAIGKEGDLIWHLPADLKHFKAVTLGHPVIMGRKTWESLPKKPLPGRRNIILTRQKRDINGAEVANSIEEALRMCSDEIPFIIGGAEVYNSFLPYTDNIYITEIDAECKEADTFLSLDLLKDWVKTEESQPQTSDDGLKYKFCVYRRLKSSDD